MKFCLYNSPLFVPYTTRWPLPHFHLKHEQNVCKMVDSLQRSRKNSRDWCLLFLTPNELKKKGWECKVNVRKYWKRFYSIHTEIYLVKSYCSCLWLDERCIFTVVRFVLKSVNLCVYKIKTSYHGKCTRMIFSHSLRCIKKLTRSLRSVVLFFWFNADSWIKIVRAHFPRIIAISAT